MDGGGFATFERYYPLTSVVTLTAERSVDGSPFVGWMVNGVRQRTSDSASLQIVIEEDVTVKALYRGGKKFEGRQFQHGVPTPRMDD